MWVFRAIKFSLRTILAASYNFVLFFFFFLAVPAAGRGSQARDQTLATAVARATAVEMPDL